MIRRRRSRRSRTVRALVVVAHPNHDSYTAAVAAAAISALTAAGHHVDMLDLYAEDFRADMSLEERRAYHGDAPLVTDETVRHADLVCRAEWLVFVYPTWWSGLPAILKGWLDRVMVPGVAFTFDPRSDKVRPGLRQVRRIIGISTYGSTWPYVKLINDNGRRMLTRALRTSCGLRARTTWLALYGMDRATPQRLAEHLTDVSRRIGSLK